MVMPPDKFEPKEDAAHWLFVACVTLSLILALACGVFGVWVVYRFTIHFTQ